MANEAKKRMNGQAALAMDDASEGAGRATGNASSIAPPDPDVMATARRRQFSSAERLRILTLADRCTKAGEIGALPRREGIYSSLLAIWRKKRVAVEQAALEPQKRGRKADPALAEARRLDQRTRENDRLRRQLAQAHTIIDVQKKFLRCWGSSRTTRRTRDPDARRQCRGARGWPGARLRRLEHPSRHSLSRRRAPAALGRSVGDTIAATGSPAGPQPCRAAGVARPGEFHSC